MADKQQHDTDKDKQRSGQMKQDMDHTKGGQQGSKSTNPGNFANDREKASQAGKKGGEAPHGRR